VKRLLILLAVAAVAVVAVTSAQAGPTASQASCNDTRFLNYTASLALTKAGSALKMVEINHYAARRTALQARNVIVTGTLPCHRLLIKYRGRLWLYLSEIAEASNAWGDSESVTYWLQKGSETLDEAGFYLKQYRNR
jgi:hypothetical protein